MENFFCPDLNAGPLTSVARDVCPFPNYNPSPLVVSMLSPNSSLHLKNHYTAVQSSLTPKQLEDFTQGLRTTFGREGRVTLGGVGVVALSLAVLFDTLAKQVRGEWVPESGPIPGLFVKDLRGYYPPHVYTVSEYLRLVPHIANNPTRMREETERYIKQLTTDERFLEKLGENHTLPIKEDITVFNLFLSHMFAASLQLHYLRIKNATDDDLVRLNSQMWPSSPDDIIFNFNCDPEEADKDFLVEVQRSDIITQEALKSHNSDVPKTWLHEVAKLAWGKAMSDVTCVVWSHHQSVFVAQREDFDLKATALGKWAE